MNYLHLQVCVISAHHSYSYLTSLIWSTCSVLWVTVFNLSRTRGSLAPTLLVLPRYRRLSRLSCTFSAKKSCLPAIYPRSLQLVISELPTFRLSLLYWIEKISQSSLRMSEPQRGPSRVSNSATYLEYSLGTTSGDFLILDQFHIPQVRQYAWQCSYIARMYTLLAQRWIFSMVSRILRAR